MSHCVAKHGKTFTDGEYIKEAFLSTAEVLFEGLPNKDTMTSRIKEVPLSARTVERRLTEMAENVSQQQTSALKNAPVFSMAVDESMDINDVPHLAIVASWTTIL
ncbi:hypothetical protein LDENG_00216470 [Lucifuga dentata]|nr:hypothetical protein LDENG_00216470 [Lucifuga dentata]